MATKSKPGNKQRDKRQLPSAASFVRVGKRLKVRAANYRRNGQKDRADWLTDVADEMRFEGEFVRTLRKSK